MSLAGVLEVFIWSLEFEEIEVLALSLICCLHVLVCSSLSEV